MTRGGEAHAEQPVLLIDQFLPRYDLAIVHAEVLRAAPERSPELPGGARR